MLDSIRSLSIFSELTTRLRKKESLPGLALPRSARLPVTAALYQELNCPLLLLTDRTDRALTITDELKYWEPNIPISLFPEPNPMFYEQMGWGSTVRRDRLQVLSTLSIYHMMAAPKPNHPPLIVAPVRAVMTRTIPRRDFLISSRSVRPGQNVQPEALQRSWVEIGYQPADIVVETGQFSRRGGLLDIWPTAEPFPVRLDFFGDELETLRRFDPATQRTIENLERLLVTPARELLPSRLNLPSPLSADLMEFYLAAAHTTPATLLDYLPPQALILLDDLDHLQSAATEIEEQAVKQRQEAVEEGLFAPDFPVPYLSWSELRDTLDSHSWLELGRSTAPETPPFSDVFESGPRFGGRLKPMMDFTREHCQAGDRVVVVSRQVPRLLELWEEKDCPETSINQIEFHEGSLTEGWILSLPNKKCLLMTDSEIFGWERPKPRLHRRIAAEAPEAHYADLKPGDWVVHMDYGIGRYRGLVLRTIEGIEREFLCLEYDNNDEIYIPVHQADRLTRYIGPNNEEPNPTRLGTPEWSTARQKANEAAQEVARELLDLYARRQLTQGKSFSADTAWQHDLENSFPYIETDDQLKAVQEVKRDMESPRPMDRLLCGDVGYGKTEVALRAAFKAVMDSKQVAVLVPTTVLAQQHYETFCQRLAAFPVEVEMLSRFRNPKQQEEILKRLSIGSLDIIIGTHRLIQADVTFDDLGLVIIDEEQRFGVTHKEYLKRLRTEVDVLTLTATPIPRTLYMALTGVRDISTINTPPEERLPIITHIGPYSPRLVRQALLRELERGGQVFFVHNRIQTISGMEHHLNNLVPEARIGIAHGQMPEDRLAQVMQEFTRGELDVLLCTSIIESGLDIPNANTLIVDRGDTFGLAQLYQLRGRVGRGAQRAYAYFFRHRRKPPTIEGQERLDVIAENSQLGAGYSIAMRDLEMRGAGEILGNRQHGYIASVGFHLYTRLLAMAVRSLRKTQGLSMPVSLEEHKEIRQPVSVDLPLPAGIPVDYVADQNLRLRLYRRLAEISDEPGVQSIQTEFTDRFGPPPEAMMNLFYLMQIKLRAEKVGLASIMMEGEQIVLRFPPLPEGVTSRNLRNISPHARSGKNAYWMIVKDRPNSWQQALLETLTVIETTGEKP